MPHFEPRGFCGLVRNGTLPVRPEYAVVSDAVLGWYHGVAPRTKYAIPKMGNPHLTSLLTRQSPIK